MNRISTIIVIPLFVLLATSSCSIGPNLLPNGHFETENETEDAPLRWYATRLPQTNEYTQFDWAEESVGAGKKSASIEIDETHPSEQIAYNWTETIPGCEKEGLYVLSGWVKTKELSGPAWIMVQCWSKDIPKRMLGIGTTQRDFPVTGTSDWTHIGTVFSVPEGTGEVRIRAGIATPANIGGKAWFDNIQVRELR